MEVKLDKRYPIPSGVDACWTVLSDIRATGACMPGAQITEQVDETHYKGQVKAKVGPASMQFAGEIEVLGLDAEKRSLQMLGKGADRGGSSASMKLSAHLEPGEEAGTTVLVGQATVTVSGKLAQFGSRLLVPVSDAMLAQFADNFRAAAAAVPASAPSAPASAADVAAGAVTEVAVAGVEQAAAPAAAASTNASAAAPTEALPLADALPASAPHQSVAPSSPAKANELNALGLMWIVIKGWFAGLFGRKG